jgi:hypothetical protein
VQVHVVHSPEIFSPELHLLLAKAHALELFIRSESAAWCAH